MSESPSLKRALDLVYIVDLEAARDWRRLDAAMAGGVSALWLRAPGATGSQLFGAARDLVRRCAPHGVALIVGDRADVAQAVGTPFVQLGYRSPPPRFVTSWFPGHVGVSCHSEGDLRRAAQAGAAYAVLSPIFGVPDKGEPLGVDRFALWTRNAALPVVGLGGIDRANVESVRATPAAGVAVIRALREAADAQSAAKRLSGSGVRTG